MLREVRDLRGIECREVGLQLVVVHPVLEIGAVKLVSRAELLDIVAAEAAEDPVEILVGLRLQHGRVTRLAQLPILIVLLLEVRDGRGVEAAEDQLQVVEIDGSRVGELRELGVHVVGEGLAGQLRAARLGLDGGGVELRDLGLAQAGIGARPLALDLRDLGRNPRDQGIARDRGRMGRRLDLGERGRRRLHRVGGIEGAAIGLRRPDRPIGRVIAGQVGVVDVAVDAVLRMKRAVLQRAAGLDRLDRVVDIGLHRGRVGDPRALRLGRVEIGVISQFAGLLVELHLERAVETGRVLLPVPVGPVGVVVALAGALVGAERPLELEIRVRRRQREILPDAVDQLGCEAIVADDVGVDVEQASGIDLDVDVAVGGQAVEAQIARNLPDTDRAGRRDVGLVAAGAAAVELDRRSLGAEAAPRRQVE